MQNKEKGTKIALYHYTFFFAIFYLFFLFQCETFSSANISQGQVIRKGATRRTGAAVIELLYVIKIIYSDLSAETSKKSTSHKRLRNVCENVDANSSFWYKVLSRKEEPLSLFLFPPLSFLSLSLLSSGSGKFRRKPLSIVALILSRLTVRLPRQTEFACQLCTRMHRVVLCICLAQ